MNLTFPYVATSWNSLLVDIASSTTVLLAKPFIVLEQWLQSDLCFGEISLALVFFTPIYSGDQKNIGTQLVRWRELYFRGNE